jgi:hypothetical protein
LVSKAHIKPIVSMIDAEAQKNFIEIGLLSQDKEKRIKLQRAI